MSSAPNALLSWLSTLATEPDCFYQFILDPARAAADAGLSEADQAILFSGDEAKFYAAVAAPGPSNG